MRMPTTTIVTSKTARRQLILLISDLPLARSDPGSPCRPDGSLVQDLADAGRDYTRLFLAK